MDEAGTTTTCEGTPPKVRLSTLFEEAPTLNATAELPTVPV